MNSDADKSQASHKDQHNHSHRHSGGCCSHTSNLESDYTNSMESLQIDSKEKSFLKELVKCSYLPVCRFIMSSSLDKGARIVSLAPVYINSIDDSMETVKATRNVLYELEEKGLISLDYDIPLQNYNYTQYKQSALFEFFKETVNEGKKNPSYLFDTAEIDLGSIALTELGEKVSENIEGFA